MTEEVEVVGVTFGNLTAGSTSIMPDGKVLRFHGNLGNASMGISGGNGFYYATDAMEIAHLRSAARVSRGLIWEVKDERTMSVVQTPPPEFEQAKQDVIDTAVHAQGAGAVESKLGGIIASGEAAPTGTAIVTPNGSASATAAYGDAIAAARAKIDASK